MLQSSKYSIPGGDTKVSSEVKTSSKPPPHVSDVVKQKLQSPRADNVQKSQDKRKIKNPFRQLRFDEHRPARRASEGPAFWTKCVKNSEKHGNERKVNEKDELVKHMRNLPGYLQKVEKVENIQDKALNFGVLDWNRLEKWKYSDSELPRRNANVSFSGSSLTRHMRQPSSNSSRPYPGKEKGLSRDVEVFQIESTEKNIETSLKNTFDEKKIPQHANIPYSMNSSGIKSERGMRRHIDRIVIPEKETTSSGSRKNEVPKSDKDVSSARRKVITSREELLQSSECLDKECCSDKEKRIVLILPKHSPKPNLHHIIHSSEPIFSIDGTSKEANEEALSTEASSEEVRFEPPLRSNTSTQTRNLKVLGVDSCSSYPHPVSPRHNSVDMCTPKSNFLRRNGTDTPRSLNSETYESETMKGTVASPSCQFSFNFGKISRSLSFKESSAVPGHNITSVTVKSGPIRSEPSHRFSFDGVHSSGELYPYILHLFPLPTGSESKDDHNTRIENVTSISKVPNKQTSESPIIGSSEFDLGKNRHSSPNRRFGFNLGKMKRSFSFKEGLNVPQLVPATCRTVKSGPVKSEVADYLATLIETKDCLHSKSRSNSPLRRLLDPFLNETKDSFHSKSRSGSPLRRLNPLLNETKDSLHSKSRSSSPLRRLLDPILKTSVTYSSSSTGTSPLLKQNPNTFAGNESLNYKKPQESIVQALLQATTKNGLPLFKLVVNNSSDILVAMKNIIPSGKQDVDSIYTFYSVHEVKKNGSWINQVHKEKSYGFCYNVIGQMKGFNRFCTEPSAGNFEGRSKEFVVYTVDRKQGDEEAPELVPTRELASIIVRVPPEKSNIHGDERNIGKELTGKEFLEYLEEEKYLIGTEEIEKFHDTTVILPGADHGLPRNGVPSSLIQRWRSGGFCDCGGWDVGCKLQILTNSSVSSPNRDCFDLFNQGGAHDSKPIFRLAPFKKGLYSIEFSASFSLLQALSTCIAAISSRQSFDLSELNFLSEVKLVEESSCSRGSETLIPSKCHKSSGKYVPPPPPPPSPVGRL